MKNPFLNTDNYAVVREYKRITKMKRSVSQTAKKQYKHLLVPRIEQIFLKFTDYLQLERKFQKNFIKINDNNCDLRKTQQIQYISLRRPQIFGMEKNKLTPRYQQNDFHNYSNFCWQNGAINQRGILRKDKSYKNSQNAFLKSYSSSKFEQKVAIKRKSSQQNQLKNQQKIRRLGDDFICQQLQIEKINEIDNYMKNDDFQEEQQNNKKFCSSVLDSLLNISPNVENKQMNKCCYESYADLSKKFIERNISNKRNQEEKIIIKRSGKKKCSMFQMIKSTKNIENQSNDNQDQIEQRDNQKIENTNKQKEKENKSSNKKLSNLSKQYCSYLRKQNKSYSNFYLGSKKKIKNQKQFLNQDLKKQKPPIIRIKQKLFYLYKKPYKNDFELATHR